jgi:cytochrome c oxidase subunit 3
VAAGATASPAGIVEPFQTVGPFWLPTINTALLLTSGVTLTIAHHALRENQRGKTIAFMWAHGAAGHHVPVRAGLRVLPPLHRLNLKLSLVCSVPPSSC